MIRVWITVLLLTCVPSMIRGWVALPHHERNPFLVARNRRSHSPATHTSTDSSSSSLAALEDPSSPILLAEESWRQYVPLAVSVLVIVDILLGSPVANAVMAPLRQQAEEEGMFATPKLKNPKERIDSEQVAQAALDRARSSLELREFLDRQKTDWDRMEEMRKAMDKQMADLDQELEAKKKPKE